MIQKRATNRGRGNCGRVVRGKNRSWQSEHWGGGGALQEGPGFHERRKEEKR